MIRIAMVTPFPIRAGAVTGGVEGVAVSLVKTLPVIEDVEITILSPIADYKWAEATRNNAAAVWIPRSKLPGFIDYWSILRRRLHDKLKALAPDITHFQGAAGWMLGFEGPAVLTVHGVIERDARYSSKPFARLRGAVTGVVEKIGRKRASDVIVISPYLRNVLDGQFSGNLWDIENPIEESWFSVSRQPDFSRILYVGRISQRKNVDGLLAAFKRVVESYPSAQLILAGAPDDPKFAKKCDHYVQTNSLTNNVSFLGGVDRSIVLMEMRRAACLVLVSHQETAPLVIEEAMASGVPVVASNICGHPFMVTHNETGCLVDGHDVKCIADKLISLIGDPERNIEMGRSARAHAAKRFHPNVVASATLDVYHSILRRKRGGRQLNGSIA